MQLGTYSDYALRVLMKLAAEPGKLTTIREVADVYGISSNHLMKVTQELGRNGYIETVRGRGGGLRLEKPLTEINIGEVIRVTEGNLALVECFAANRNQCTLSEVCLFRGIMSSALDAFFAVLDRYTLADLMADREAMRTILNTKACSPHS